MTGPNDDAGSGNARGGSCHDCGAERSPTQRYCLECGARQGPLPGAVAKRIDSLRERGRRAEARAKAAAPAALAATAAPAEAEDGADREDDPWRFMPSPQVAAIAVMALLAAGVILGSVTDPIAQGAGAASIVLDLAEPPAESEAEEPVAEESGYEVEAPVAEAPAEVPLAPVAEAPAEAPAATPPPQLPPELPEEEALPEIKHVFLIVLNGHGYEEAFGEASPAPYLAKTLTEEGKLLTNYFSVAEGGLANEVALISGQGPTPQTVLDCPEYTAITPGALSPEGQVEGQGCVYPAEAKSLPEQFAEAELKWKAYVEDIGAGAGQPTTCRHPALGGADPNAKPLPGDAFQTWRNPFVYFTALTESPECGESDVGLDQLATDLKEAKDTPAFSYIVPNACHDGGDTPCAPEAPAGLAASEEFLKTVVPEITASPAYQTEGGLIAITFDQASRTAPEPDASSCCAPPEYPNLPPPPAGEPPATGPVKPTGGGGRVGMLLISPYVAPGTVVEETGYYNHFSFLRSVEELFEFEPLGYAAEPALAGFDSTVYDASPEESTVAEGSSAKQPLMRRVPLVEQDQHGGEQPQHDAADRKSGARRSG